MGTASSEKLQFSEKVWCSSYCGAVHLEDRCLLSNFDLPEDSDKQQQNHCVLQWHMSCSSLIAPDITGFQKILYRGRLHCPSSSLLKCLWVCKRVILFVGLSVILHDHAPLL
ncbi:uncharacterized protein LOC103022477 [Astyanax mexicanus]|uniref:uncharacterized protein LOC103022477 n=1 Tax=Astyanax mexicanus TaxID=7994 RepID=UPI0020CAB447|nr:uncharacterized protein LOC103022477 [Astyanax mexicanus]